MSIYVTSIEQLKDSGIKISKDLDFDMINDALVAAEENYIKPILTPEYFNELAEKETKSAEETELIVRITRAVGYFALKNKLQVLGMTIDSTGVYKSKGTTKWFLSDTELHQNKQALYHMATDALEVMLQYLEDKTSENVFAGYYTSRAYRKQQKLRIKSPSHFGEYYDIANSYRVFRVLRPILFNVQKEYIQPVLNGYYDTFLTLEYPNDSAALENIIELAESALVHYTVARALFDRKVELTGSSVVVVDQKERYGTQQTVKASELISTHNSLLKQAQSNRQALEEAIEALNPEGYTAPEAITTINSADNGIYYAG